MTGKVTLELIARGVQIPAPEHVFIAPEVVVDRIEAGATLMPWVRLHGEKTAVGRGARLGTGGPVCVRDSVIGRDVELSAGTFEGAVFLDGAQFGPAGYARPGTLFEEGARAGHGVGTKQTILLPFATLGSLINFCDCLLAGGSSAEDHSEVGSGFIHFNFTPNGKHGDKATPSMFGDVVRGVFLRGRRIFLGGNCGVVGPMAVGYGSVLAAGSVYRRDRGDGVIVYAEQLPARERSFDPRIFTKARGKVQRNLAYISELIALRSFYRQIRRDLVRGDAFATSAIEAADLLLAAAVDERTKQLARLADDLVVSAEILSGAEHDLGDDGDVAFQRGFRGRLETARATLGRVPEISVTANATSTLLAGVTRPTTYVEWVRGLTSTQVAVGERWLVAVRDAWLSQHADLLASR